MSTDILLAMHANRSGRAVPRTSVRHVHLIPKPFIVVGYHLPGDPSVPIGLLYGDRADRPRLAITAQPLRWRSKIDGLVGFARGLNRYVGSFTTGDESRAPQLVFPNQTTAEWLCGDMGRYLRNMRLDGDWAVDESILTAGANLSYFAGRQIPGSSAVLPLAEVLSNHWATGRLSSLDRHLGIELAWISRPDTIAAEEAALSDGPVPDAAWEKDEYLKALSAYDRDDGSHRQAVEELIRQTVRDALTPAWRACWEALDLLRARTAADSVARRWDMDRRQFHNHADRLRGNRASFRTVLPLLDTYRHIQRMERDLANVAREMAFDDPIIMATHVANGDALNGTVTNVAGTTLTVQPRIPFGRAIGTRLWWRTRVTDDRGTRFVYIELEVIDIDHDGTVTLNVRRGAVQASVRNRLPVPGSTIVCAPFGAPDYYPDTFPDELPWTHRSAAGQA